MKKIKTLALAALPIATVGATTAMTVTSCNKVKVATMTYDEAKEWVKNNYGETSNNYTLAKAVSTWGLTGWINMFGKTEDVGQNNAWLYSHIDNLLIALTYAEQAQVKKSAPDRKGATFSKDTTTGDGTMCAVGDIAFGSQVISDTPIEVEPDETLLTLSAENFDSTMDLWFRGTFKYNAEYIAVGKNLTVHGTLSYYKEASASGNWDDLKVPNFYLTYDSKGRLVEAKLDCEQLTTCAYWYQNGTYCSGYSFMLNAGSYINSKYSVTE